MAAVVRVSTLTVNITGVALMVYAKRYRMAALRCLYGEQGFQGFDPVPYSLFCQSLELHLKSFIWLRERVGSSTLKSRYGHNLTKLWTDAKSKGISRYANPTPLRNTIINMIGPYYKGRQLHYLDIDMVVSGYETIKSEPRVLPVLNRLTQQLERSLDTPIQRAS